jgi:uncharacterized membrane protein
MRLALVGDGGSITRGDVDEAWWMVVGGGATATAQPNLANKLIASYLPCGRTGGRRGAKFRPRATC